MKERALYYYRNGYNCSQCILKAAESVYRIPLPRNLIMMCNGVNNGFGVGGMCSVLIAGIMVFGALFDDTDTKRLRMKLLDSLMFRRGSLNCRELMKNRRNGYLCTDLVGDTAELIEQIIAEG